MKSSAKLSQIPSAASGASITPTGVAWTSSAYAEVSASAAAGAVLAGIQQLGSSLGGAEQEIDVSAGAGGAEVVVSTFRMGAAASGPTYPFMLPVPVSGITGARVAARQRSSSTSTTAVLVSVSYYESPDAGITTSAPLTCVPTAAAGVSVTVSSTSQAWSAYAALTAGIDTQIHIAGLAPVMSVSHTHVEHGLATGAAGAETEITRLRGHGAAAGGTYSWALLPGVYTVSASTRVACRFRHYGTSTGTLRVSLLYYGDAETVPALQRVTQLVLTVGTDEYADDDPPPTTTTCTGGGTVAVGANPADGTALATATALHAWVETTIGPTTYRWAKVAINHGEPKTPRVLSFGTLRRALSSDNGGFESASLTILLSDYDRVLRGLHATNTLMNQSMSVYVADEATIRSGGTPWRVFRGVIRDFRPESELKYRIDLEDPLTLAMSAFAQEKLIPSQLISVSDGTADQGLRQAPVPVLYGPLSDEIGGDDDPIGTIEAPFIGTETVAGHQELGNLHKHLIGKSPCGHVSSVFIGDPLSGDPPKTRAKAGESEYGTRLYVPHKSGWFLSTNYSVEDDIRWTFLYVDQHHPGADLARYNRIPIAVNVCGREDIGDGTAETIDSLPLQVLHALNTEVLQSVGDEDWPAQATRDGYSILDTATFTDTKSRGERRVSGGAIGAFVLGHSFKQITLRTFLKQASISGGFDFGVNRHGQIMISMLDRTADASNAVTLTDQSDILKDSFTIDPRLDAIENQVQYAYARNYLKTLQQLNPDTDERLPREPFDKDWLSTRLTINDTTEQGLLGETRTSPTLEMELVRDGTWAADVAQQRLDLRSPSNGRAEATFDVRLTRGYNIELGDLVKVTHFQGLGSTGWSNRRCQVRRHEVDLDRFTVTLTVRDVDDLLLAAPAAPAVTWDGANLTWDGEVVTWS